MYGDRRLQSADAAINALLQAAGADTGADFVRPPTLDHIPDGASAIPLHGGRSVLVDSDDAPGLAMFRWYTKPMGRQTAKYYAVRTVQTPCGPRHIYMHRQLMDAPGGMVVDHLNGDSLDNRRANLRVCTRGENARNIDRSGNITRGAVPRGDRWAARTCIDGKTVHLGTFDTQAEAFNVASCARTKRHSSRTRLFSDVGNWGQSRTVVTPPLD